MTNETHKFNAAVALLNTPNEEPVQTEIVYSEAAQDTSATTDTIDYDVPLDITVSYDHRISSIIQDKDKCAALKQHYGWERVSRERMCKLFQANDKVFRSIVKV